MRKTLAAIFAVLTLASAGAPQEPKLAEVDVDPIFGLVSAKGVWRPDNPTKNNKLVETVTELSCFRHGGKDVVGTEAFCLEATADMLDGTLDVGTRWLKVVEWNQTQVIATADSRVGCVTSRTTFDLKRKTVIALDIRKPEAQGLAGACNVLPDRQTYYFQDRAVYFAHKIVAK
jgi:hypothetical protein